MKQKAIFIDRDGVINKEIGRYVTNIDDFTLNPGVLQGFKKLKEAGYDKKEPEPRDYIRKNEKLFALVRKLVIKEEITINKAAEVLNIPVSEMRKLAKKWKNYEYRTALKL